ncbi:MAG: MFS transporter [Armatimonadetes bacterium]|nr:MFS transporter [Armatimonadota bacterium]
MLKRLFGRLNAAHPQLVLFLLASGLLAAASGAFETTFNNYLDDTFRVTAAARGALEFPRELPGFLVALLAGALFFLPEARVGALAAAATGLGMIGLGLIGPSWPLMLTCMILWSTGMHVGMPIGSSLGMSLASAERRGRRVGQIGGVRTAATIIGCAFVWLTVDYWKQGYSLIFFFGGALALLAAVGFWRMRGIGVEGARPSLVVRKEYWLYYVLALLFGARKQLFITFGPWVLVRVFHQPASTFARLWIVAALIGIFFNPLLGRLIDRVGERTILVADALLLLLVCAGYGFADRLGLGGWEVYVLYACFIIDQLLFSVNMARDTWMSKIAVRQEDIAPTLSLGITLNHAVSMSLPTLGGLVWDRYGYQWVFVGAACVALVMLVFTSRVRTPVAGATPLPAAAR